MPGQPGRGEHRPQRPPHRGSRAAQPDPDHPAARDGRGVDRRRRLGRRRGDQPARRIQRTRPSTTSAGPVTRARAGSRATTATELSICARRSTRAAATRRPSSPTATRPGRAGRGVRGRQLLGHGGGVRLYGGGAYPAEYDGALFFADYLADCIWVHQAHRRHVAEPGGDIELRRARAHARSTSRWRRPASCSTSTSNGGTIRRIVYSAGNRPPVAVATPNGRTATCRSPSTSTARPRTTRTRPARYVRLGPRRRRAVRRLELGTRRRSPTPRPGTYTVKLKVTDVGGASATDAITISAGNTPPDRDDRRRRARASLGRSATRSPSRAAATDEQDGTLPASALSWSLTLEHCPSNCHRHPIRSWPGTGAGPASSRRTTSTRPIWCSA